jgi:hypothetical protein
MFFFLSSTSNILKSQKNKLVLQHTSLGNQNFLADRKLPCELASLFEYPLPYDIIAAFHQLPYVEFRFSKIRSYPFPIKERNSVNTNKWFPYSKGS